MKIALAKVHVESLNFEDIWERWMNEEDRRFRK
jgi:hypothetical protein